MFPKGKDTDQLNALQLLMNWPQLVATLLFVPFISVHLNLENFAVSPAFPSMPAAMLTVPLVATVLLWSLQTLFIFLVPMRKQKTIVRGTWENEYTNNYEEEIWRRWVLGTLNFTGSALTIWALMHYGPVVVAAVVRFVLFLAQSYLLAALVVPLALFAAITYAPTLINKLRPHKV